MTAILLGASAALGATWYLGATVAMPAALLWSPAYRGVLRAMARVHDWITHGWVALLTCLEDLLAATLPVPTTVRRLPPLTTRPALRLLLPICRFLRAPPTLA